MRRGAESRRRDSARGRLLQRGAGTAEDRLRTQAVRPGRGLRAAPSLSAPRESCLEGRVGSAIGAAGRLPLRVAAIPELVCGVCQDHAQLLPCPFLPAAGYPPRPSASVRGAR